METTNNVLLRCFKRLGLEAGLKQANAVGIWAREAGPAVAAVTEADSIRDGVLWVRTKSSAWSQELSMQKEPLIRRLNEALGAEVVKDIRFQVKRKTLAAPPIAPKPEPLLPLTEPEKAAVKRMTEQLDPEVGQHIARVMEADVARRKAGRKCPVCQGPLHRSETTCPFCRRK